MPILSDAILARLRTLRAEQMTETGVVRRKPPGPHTGDVRQWPVTHTEPGLLTSSRRMGQDREGLLRELDTPQWVTTVDSATQPGDALQVRDRWFFIGAARTQTVQTACVFSVTEVRF